MRKIISTMYVITAFCLFSSCSVYQSADRKQFESDHASFRAENLTFASCSENSIAEIAENSKLFNITHAEDGSQNLLLWEHHIQGVSVFETDNLQGVYCIYETH